MRFDRPKALLFWLTTATCALLLIGGCLEAIPPNTITPEDKGSIEGVVKDQCSNKGVPGVTVFGGGRQSTTDGQGRYALEALDAGPLQLRVTLDGYLEARPQATIQAGAKVSLDITLSPEPKQHPVDKLDVLFLIDNSGSMAEEQAALQREFPSFLATLAQAFSSVHIGVVSPDLGAGTYNLPTCEAAGGDGGILQSTPRIAGCNAPTDPYLDLVDGEAVNVTGGDAVDAFSCIAKLGTSGCGFEQPLEALRLALSPGANPGFLRDDAMLAVVLITDEDDCSAEDVTLYDPSNEALGGLSSFRCFEYGVTCDVNGREVGPRSDCKPSAQMLFDVQRYVSFFEQLKASTDQIFFAAVAGPTDRVEVGTEGQNPTLQASCQSAMGIAVPAIRIRAVVEALNPGVSPKPFFSICETLPMAAIGQQLINATSFRTCL